MTIQTLSLIGGLLFLLILNHLIVDFIFQSHYQAANKHNNWKIRAQHCLIYVIGFLPIMVLFGFQFWKIIVGCIILLDSHFLLDSYIMVFLWAKHIRKPPEMNPRFREPFLSDRDGFSQFIQNPLGLVLAIIVDQLCHIIFLLPLVWMAIN